MEEPQARALQPAEIPDLALAGDRATISDAHMGGGMLL